ncbi:MAG: hypothetical protein R3F61_06715 [Myxococcota bacterium]
MKLEPKRIAIVAALVLLPVTAFAAAAASGADGGFCANLLGSLFSCSSGGCPHP